MCSALPLASSRRAVVFDLDETLGAFADASVLWRAICAAGLSPPSEPAFSAFLDTFPQFIRPGIIPLLRDLCQARNGGHIDHILIMTNNQGPPAWTESIARHLSHRVGTLVFDHIIHAYAGPEGRREKRRRGHDKSLDDLCSCCGWSPRTPPKICFIDDRFHSLSAAPGVIFIPVSPYRFLPSATAASRLIHRNLIQKPPGSIADMAAYLVTQGLPAQSPILSKASRDNALLIQGLSMLVHGTHKRSKRKSRRRRGFTRRRLRFQ